MWPMYVKGLDKRVTMCYTLLHADATGSGDSGGKHHDDD